MTNFRRDDESPSEYAERVERCEARAGWYFADATKAQLARYNLRMSDASAYRGSRRWARERTAAQEEFTAMTAAARELCGETLRELMTAGEVSEDLSYRWDLLPVAAAMLETEAA